jgi:hypothetical protein
VRPSCPARGDVGHVTDVGTGCGGRVDVARRAAWMRTAKSCGPDARIAGVKCSRGQRLPGAMVARGSDSPGRARYTSSSHCAGKAGVFPLNLYARVRISCDAHCTRDRGCSAHPVFPAPSYFWGANDLQASDKTMSRERELTSSCHRPAPVLDLIGDDRATQYSRAPMMNTNALEYWVTRFRG